MNYSELKKNTNIGWNTWNTTSVMSHALLPYGFAINLCIKDHSHSNVLREALIGRFGNEEEHIFPHVRSWDGKYTSINVKYIETEFNVESAVINNEQLILVTPLKNGLKPATLIVEACLLWGKEGTLGKRDGRIFGDFDDGKHIEIYTSGQKYDMPYTYSLSPSYTVDMTEPIAVSTFPCSADEARKLIDEAKKSVYAEAEKYGINSEAYIAIKSCLAWDTIYECEKDRLCSPVSRMWNKGWGGYVLFDWDTFFAAMIASVDNKELAYLNALAIANEVTEKGFVPNFACNDNLKSRDRSQPPVGSMVAMELYKKYKEPWFICEMYDNMIGWNRWFAENRMTDEGYMCWGSNKYEPVNGRYFEKYDTGNLQGAAFESGLDNSPMYDNVPFDNEREISLLADVGLMGLYIKDCKSLIEMAKISGNEADIPEIEARLNKVEAALMTLWSEKDGMFLNKNLVTNELSRRVSPTNFYSFYSDKVSESQKKSMIDNYFYNPKEFWGDYIMPSISRSDPGYKDQTYWRGRIWAPMNYLVYNAFKDAGLNKDAKALAEKSRELLLKEWNAHGHVHENYSGDDGWGCGVGNSDKFYHWGGLLGYIAIDAENLK